MWILLTDPATWKMISQYLLRLDIAEYFVKGLTLRCKISAIIRRRCYGFPCLHFFDRRIFFCSVRRYWWIFSTASSSISVKLQWQMPFSQIRPIFKVVEIVVPWPGRRKVMRPESPSEKLLFLKDSPPAPMSMTRCSFSPNLNLTGSSSSGLSLNESRRLSVS